METQKKKGGELGSREGMKPFFERKNECDERVWLSSEICSSSTSALSFPSHCHEHHRRILVFIQYLQSTASTASEDLSSEEVFASEVDFFITSIALSRYYAAAVGCVNPDVRADVWW